MDHIFTVDKMDRVLNEPKEFGDIRGPIIQHLIWGSQRSEFDGLGRAIDFCPNGAFYH